MTHGTANWRSQVNFGEIRSRAGVGSVYREEERTGVIMFLGEYCIDYNKDGAGDADPVSRRDIRPNMEACQPGEMVVSMETRTPTSRQRSMRSRDNRRAEPQQPSSGVLVWA